MKIATWNVNSIRARLDHLLDWLKAEIPDVVALQETKTVGEKFPVDEIRAAGYRVVFSGQKTYNGVAVLSRGEAGDVVRDLAGLDDPQRRLRADLHYELRLDITKRPAAASTKASTRVEKWRHLREIGTNRTG